LERDNAKKEIALKNAQKEAIIRDRQTVFLKGSVNQKTENLINGMHAIFTLSDAIKKFMNHLSEILYESSIQEKDGILNELTEIYQANKKINKLAELAIHGHQQLKQQGKDDIQNYIMRYIEEGLSLKGLNYVIQPSSIVCDCEFDPASVGIVIDNIASNSIKARANQLIISFAETRNTIDVSFTDNGIGLSSSVNCAHLFEWGYTTTKSQGGFGIGLYHIKLLVDSMHGSVQIEEKYSEGFRLVVSFKK
jgi:signal transduction histidine kinase